MRLKKLRLGVVGGGIQSAVGYAHFAASRMDNRFAYEAGCFSRNTSKNQESAAEYHIDENRIYSSLEEMLQQEQTHIDAILLLTPTPEHYKQVKLCIEKGMPVICEKSLAMNYAEAKELEALVQEKSAFLAVTYNYAGYPLVREIKKMIAEGELGEILHFQAEMPQEGFLRTDALGRKFTPQEWRLLQPEIPVIYLDLAMHIHHLLYYVLDMKATKVIASQKSEGWFENVIDNVQCLTQFGGKQEEVQGSIWFSKSSLGYRNGLKLRIFGTKASVEWIQTSPEELYVSYQDGSRRIVDRAAGVTIANKQRYTRFKAGHPAGYVEAFANLYSDIADSLLEYQKKGTWKNQEVAGATTAAEGLLFLEKMAQSATDETWKYIEY